MSGSILDFKLLYNQFYTTNFQSSFSTKKNVILHKEKEKEKKSMHEYVYLCMCIEIMKNREANYRSVA
jgi:hypothetical protein